MLIAFAHVVGAIAVLTVFGLVLLWISTWEAKRNQKRVLQEISTNIGIPVTDLETEANLSKVARASSERYSNELLQNRLSDFCGHVRTLWGWTGALLQYSMIGYAIWTIFSEGPENAAIVWVAVLIAIFFGAVSLVFSFVCHILTGRLPGEARTSRKAIAKYNGS